MKTLSSADAALFELARHLKSHNYQFTTGTPLTHSRVNARPENYIARDWRDIFGWSRPFERGLLAPELFDMMQRAEIVESEGALWRSRVRFSTLEKQLFVHSAYPTTQSDAVFFGPDTYRYARALQECLPGLPHVKRAVDIGCGSGVGAILAALQFPDAQIVGVDINPLALRTTQINAALAGVKNVRTQISDVLNETDGKCDFICANPPYLVDESERAYRHGGGPLGAGLSLRIVEESLARLDNYGTLLLYTGAAIVDGVDVFRAEVAARLEKSGVRWFYEEMDVDVFSEELECAAYARTERIAAVVLRVIKT